MTHHCRLQFDFQRMDPLDEYARVSPTTVIEPLVDTPSSSERSVLFKANVL